MRLVFESVPEHPLLLKFKVIADNGSTIHGSNAAGFGALDPVQNWCKEQNCGTFLLYENPGFAYFIRFENTEKLAFFLLRWG